MAKVIIKRKNSVKYFFRVPFSVYVDGNLIGSLLPFEKIECDLKEGKHLIEVESPTKKIEQGIIIEKKTKSVEIVLGSIRVFIYSIPQVREIIFRGENDEK